MLQATVLVRPDRRIGRISPNIYGHFIEHLGRCINGGVWGEMLHARKFVGFDHTRNGLPDPWEKVGGRAPQLLCELQPDGPGRNILVMRCLNDARHAVSHGGLAVRRGVRYSAALEVKADGDLREVELSLGGVGVSRPAPNDWERWEVEFTAVYDSDDAALEIACMGAGRLSVRSPSLMRADDRAGGGFRQDVLTLTRRINPPVVRWPGGCFADGYRWQDGIGPRDERPTAFDPAWAAWEPNDFGTLEFVAWCRAVGAEPYICVNTGSDTSKNAAAWVSYCNSGANTTWGAVRSEDGHTEPLDVRYWSIGNETYGSWEIGNVPADEYGRLFLEFAGAMRAVDPDIELIAVGADPVDRPDWNRTVLEIVGDEMDYLSVHRYVPHTRDDAQLQRQYRAIVAAPVDIERRLRMVAETIDEVLGEGSGVRIAFDEWNVWLDATGDEGIEESYEARDAVFAAGVLNALQRLGGWVAMANLAQLVNVLPAIETSQTGAWGTALHPVFELFTDACESIAVECQCRSPRFDAESFGNIPALSDVPWVDASASLSEEGTELAVALVNRSPDSAAQVEIGIEAEDGFRPVEVSRVVAAHMSARNTQEGPAAVTVQRERPEEPSGVLLLPAHSAAVAKFKKD